MISDRVVEVPYLKKIEIKGFKTFAHKTVLLLDKGFTVITGPNGSGKTNIIDAILFGLGELSAKRLRAENFSKLIFHGNPSSNLKRERKARVLIQLDNSDGHIPVETATVTISREIDENGQSIYRLNGRRISRSDLIDILSVAGISPYGHNVIVQGTITRLAEISSHERRKMIEDLTGIAQYDEEKAEAEEKLRAADLSIKTAMGQVGEVQRRLEDLERERNNLLRFNLIKREMKRLEAMKASYELEEVDKRIRRLSSRIHEIEENIREINYLREQLRMERREAEEGWRRVSSDMMKKGQAQLLQIQFKIGDLKSELSEVTAKIRSEEANLERQRRLQKNIENQIDNIKSEIEDLKNKRKDLLNTHKTIKNELSNKQVKYELVSKNLMTIRSTLKETSQKIRDRERILDDLNQRLISVRGEIAKSKSKINIYSQRLRDLKSRREDLRSTVDRLHASLKELHDIQKGQEERLSVLEEQLKRRISQRKMVEREMEEAEKIAEVAKRAVVEFSSQKALIEKIRSEEAALRSIEELGEVGVIDGIYGRLRRLVKIKRGYERAIEAAASGWLDALVVKDLDVAFTCNETLRKLKLGRIKIIPLNGLTLKNSDITPPKLNGMIGPASSFIRCPSKYQPAVLFVFGDTYIFPDEKTALEASRAGLRSVTVNGNLYEVGGAVEGGFYRKPIDYSSIVPSESAIKNLDRAVNALIEHLRKRGNYIERISNEISDMKVELSRLKDARSRLEKEIQRISSSITRTDRNIKRIERTIQNIEDNIEKERVKIGRYKLERIKILSDERRIKGELSRLKAKTDPTEIQDMEAERDSLGDEIIQLREKLGLIENEISMIESKVKDVLEASLKNFKVQLERVRNEIKGIEEEISKATDYKAEIERQINELEEERSSLSSKLLGAEEEAKRYMSKIESVDDRLQDVEREYDQLNKILNEVRFEVQTLQFRREQLLRRLKELGYEEPIKVHPSDLSHIERSFKTMNSELERIGAVNQLADSQYAEQLSRYKELSIRMNELEQERMAILKFIEEIERKKYRTFMEAFNRVNESLARYFSKLTGGGKASLKLEKPEDPFSGGVEMTVQFPNKPPILISGASSGERSVAAVAFLFALQGLSPSSFYLFDEVDAHLDPFHVEKLGELLAEESSKSQFLVITLKPELVSKAEKIYGVYGRNGVSYIVSTTFKGAG